MQGTTALAFFEQLAEELGHDSFRCDCHHRNDSDPATFENMYFRDTLHGVTVTYHAVRGRFLGLHVPAGWLPLAERPAAERTTKPDFQTIQYNGDEASVFVSGVLSTFGQVGSCQ